MDDLTPAPWEALVRKHRSRVQRHAYRLTRDHHEAEDLTQEVFVRAFLKLAASEPASVGAWLHRVTTNVFLDSVRHRKRRPQIPLPTSWAESLMDSAPMPDEALAAQTFDEDVDAALAGLNPSYRAAVLLCDVDGLSYVEVASRLHLKLGTARSHIHRGRAQLRVSLAHRSTGSNWPGLSGTTPSEAA